MRNGGNGSSIGNGNGNGGVMGRGKVRAESVIEAATLAANGQPFEVVYYPRASTLEFCVKAAMVKGAFQIRWCSGMRFKMAFETKDSSRISWFMGTISSVQVADPIRWPDSPWRLLQFADRQYGMLFNLRFSDTKCANVEASDNSIQNQEPSAIQNFQIAKLHPMSCNDMSC
ncbi:auxin response factor 8-like [Quercus robur]|uniref:auxin response factor 8-like n=1 Tax=Quercus robur TaxID=38942 RepID=UPI0021618ED4|nr:auxin response factor 8-like [Quercus robur]